MMFGWSIPIFISIWESGGHVHNQYNFFIRHKDSDTTYYFNFYAGVRDRHNLKQLKMLAMDNQKFCDFIDQMCDKNPKNMKNSIPCKQII